ncbi:hypothetical protein PPACK8108_LOCUS25344 [Phakopsora pachyrhizi]|uniref:Cryptic loci regulator 2 N-terminal domain-containing protein n=1 Tax=Phakopsora pachyrhizi TaxID=170000 RepID=A0AAV0BVH2_PHAPC|nr:hypothetical protein PPACK8108_LOCUS25344 [Phakopsora pachyrhizi]
MESGQSTPSIPENRTDPQSPARYKAVRSSNRKGPHFITCLNSDAVSSRWREVGPTVDGTGSVCYWITDDDATEAHLNRWKRTLGNALAKLLGISEGDEEWRLTELPKNYKLFRYTKGGREDVYLLGSQSVNKFRTANEFSPHVYWLCTHDPLLSGRAHCKCKYCGRVRCQSQVNLELGLSEKAKSSSEQRMVSHNKRKAEEDIAKENFRKRNISEFNQKPGPRQSYKPTQRKVLPAHIISSASNGLSSKRQTFTGPYVNKDRDRDLSEFKCAFRAAEVVWCKLDSPIDGSDGGHPDIVIEYWPAVCEERIMVSVPEILKENPDGNPPAALSTPKLKVSQNYQWKVRPLGTGDVLWRKEADLLAYLNYPVPLNFYKLLPNPKLLSHLHDGHGTDRPSITSFSTLSEAITAFALALQFSVHIKKAWTLMDRYDIAFLKRLDAIGEQLSVEDLQITYEDSTLPWYQYLWWGTEKIWSGELIRLIVSAADLPNGLRDISSRDRARCFFLKISGIYRSEQEAGMIKGPIYELADLNQREIDEKVNSSDFNEKNQPACFGRYMPEPPPGLFFRRLTPIGKEHHLVLQHIAGRYYPPHCLQSLPSHTDEDKPDPYSIDGRSLSLCGLTEGKCCETWTADRKECFKKAEALAEEEVSNLGYFNRKTERVLSIIEMKF